MLCYGFLRCSLVIAIIAFMASVIRSSVGQVVQLPTVGVTSVSTTVSVPDGGSVYLGGIGRSSSGSTSRGIGPGRLLGNRAIGSETSAGGITAHATILDMAELDEAVLAEGRARRAIASGAASRSTGAALNRFADRAAFVNRHLARGSGTNSGRAADARALAAPANSESQNSEAMRLSAEAERAVVRGRTSTAEVYYEMAAERASGELRGEIQSKLSILRGEVRGDVRPSADARFASRTH